MTDDLRDPKKRAAAVLKGTAFENLDGMQGALENVFAEGDRRVEAWLARHAESIAKVDAIETAFVAVTRASNREADHAACHESGGVPDMVAAYGCKRCGGYLEQLEYALVRLMTERLERGQA